MLEVRNVFQSRELRHLKLTRNFSPQLNSEQDCECLNCVPCRLPQVTWNSSRRAWRTTMEGHGSVIQALQNLPGIDMRIEGLHDVPQKILEVSIYQTIDKEVHCSSYYSTKLMAILVETIMAILWLCTCTKT